ncbi:MAG: hypothetical protein VX589_01930 [Myxococcota bacterium]|nr:hypothetical protein [Myxococcota bacterium]
MKTSRADTGGCWHSCGRRGPFGGSLINCVLSVLIAGCAIEPANADPGGDWSSDPSAEQSVDGEVVFYSAAPVAIDAKGRLQPVRLVRTDGTHWIRGYRLIPREFPYIGRWVKVWGTVYQPSVGVPTPVSAPHIRLKKMIPVGTLPVARAGAPFPALPAVRGIADFSGPRRRWVSLHGSLESFTRTAKDRTALLRLRDGTGIALAVPPWQDFDKTWLPLSGDEVTVMAEVSVSSGRRIDIIRVGGICAGEVGRCGQTRSRGGASGLQLRPAGQSTVPIRSAPRRNR